MSRLHSHRALCCALLLTCATALAEKAPFSVRDSIALTRIHQEQSANTPAVFSPEGDRFASVVWRGDWHERVNRYELRVYSMGEVSRYASRGGVDGLPAHRVAATIEAHGNSPGISQVQWMPSQRGQRLAFVASPGTRASYVAIADLSNHRVDALDTGPEDVVAFGVAGEHLVYVTKAAGSNDPVLEELTRGADAVGVVADRYPLTYLLDPALARQTPELEVFCLSLRDRTVRRVPLPRIRLPTTNRLAFWPAPDGSGVVLLWAPAQVPPHWRDYRMSRSWNVMAEGPRKVATIDLQYVHLDLRTLEVRALFDAPYGLRSVNFTPHGAVWMDDRKVIVSNTYLPLAGFSADERRARLAAPAFAEVDVRTGYYTKLLEEPPARDSSDQRSRVITAWSFDPSAQALLVDFKEAGGQATRESWRRTAGSWGLASGPRSIATTDTHRDPVVILQGPNQPWELAYVDTQSGRKVAFTDLNPQVRDLQMGREEVMQWEDGLGHVRRGTLLLPPENIARPPYPLVVQTYAFEPDSEWTVDGPSGGRSYGITSVFAGQPLASAGIAVLQLDGRGRSSLQDGPVSVAGLRSAIEVLRRRGLVDPAKVGMAGFSRTGSHVLHALTSSEPILRAAVAADFAQFGYWENLMTWGLWPNNYGGLNDPNGGRAPFGEGLREWIEHAPTFNLHRASAPLRLEAYDMTSLLAQWECYAALRRQGKPAELLYLPNGSHNLIKPHERYVSQQGSVDWFRFWLQDYEDSDPTKAEQYRRWREWKRAHADAAAR